MATLEVVAPGPLTIAPQERPDILDLSLILPTYNESAHIDAIVEQLVAVLDGIPALSYEIIIVDDDSPDRTWEKAMQLSQRFSQVRADSPPRSARLVHRGFARMADRSRRHFCRNGRRPATSP